MSDLVERLLFEDLFIPEPNSGCWIWLGPTGGRGYGDYRGKSAHRESYKTAKGEIPDGLVVDHLCRNILCVNPDHLEAVTIRENVLRGTSGPAENFRKIECVRGHKFTEENTIKRRGRRYCRKCQRQFTDNWYYRKQAEKKAALRDGGGE